MIKRFLSKHINVVEAIITTCVGWTLLTNVFTLCLFPLALPVIIGALGGSVTLNIWLNVLNITINVIGFTFGDSSRYSLEQWVNYE